MTGTANLLQLPPLSLYVHVPWCVRKCPYCDFNSHASPGTLPEAAYVTALVEDLENSLDAMHGRQLSSIFFGGGTPSLFSPATIGRLLLEVTRLLPVAADLEVTLEANPGTVDESHFRGYREAGINRLSLGVQSFDDQRLRALGRIHDGRAAIRAMEAAGNAGFQRVNLDLMYGLPGQTTQQATRDLRQALALAPSHISWYELTIEPNTEFYSNPPQLPQESTLDHIEQAGYELLRDAGLERYEISAFARAGEQARHNLNYWQFGDYLGIGAGAHSKLTDPLRQVVTRSWRTRMPDSYMAKGDSRVAGRRELVRELLPVEFMMNTLRLSNGVSKELFPQRTGLAASILDPALDSLRRQHLMVADQARLCTTAAGYRHLNQVLQAFMATGSELPVTPLA